MSTNAYGKDSKSGNFRRTWDDEEYNKLAKEKDEAAAEHAKQAEEAMQKGRKPPRVKKGDDLPKPKALMQAREAPLELDRNLNKTMVVATTRGKGQPGFFCDVCNRTYKDSVGYLDHLNSRGHLRQLGQTTKVERSTLDQVRLKIAELREKTQQSSDAKRYDFDARMRELRASEEETRREAREAKKRRKQEEKEKQNLPPPGADQDMMAAMGFGGFGTSKK